MHGEQKEEKNRETIDIGIECFSLCVSCRRSIERGGKERRKKGKERKEEKRKIASSIVKLVHVVAIAGLGRLCWFRRSNFKTRGEAREKFSIAFESSPRFPKYSQSWKRVGKKFWFGFLFFCGLFKPKKNHEFIIEGCLTFYFLGAGGGEIYSES